MKVKVCQSSNFTMAAEKFQDGGGPADEKFRKLTIAAERSMTIRADSMQRKQFVTSRPRSIPRFRLNSSLDT
jgi:hypothetical protein